MCRRKHRDVEELDNEQTKKKTQPRWMRHYDKIAYVILSLDAAYSIGYLVYIGIVMNERMMYIPFNKSRTWLELNSYSLMPPFFAVPVPPMLMIQVKYRTEFSDGDFYGIVGAMLGLGSISLFDSYKTFLIYTEDKITEVAEKEEFWKALKDGVEGIIYKNWVYNITMKRSLRNGEQVNIVLEYEADHDEFNKKNGYRVEKGNEYVFLAHPDNRTLPPRGSWVPPTVADKGVRYWTHYLQKKLQCCGSRDYSDWNVFNGNIYSDEGTEKDLLSKHGPYPPSCFCNYECSTDENNHEDCFEASKCGNNLDQKNNNTLKSRPGCYEKYMAFLTEVYLNTFILMLILGILYMATLVSFVINFAAIRLSKEKHVTDDNMFSLLRTSSHNIGLGPRHSKRALKRQRIKDRKRKEQVMMDKVQRIQSSSQGLTNRRTSLTTTQNDPSNFQRTLKPSPSQNKESNQNPGVGGRSYGTHPPTNHHEQPVKPQVSYFIKGEKWDTKIAGKNWREKSQTNKQTDNQSHSQQNPNPHPNQANNNNTNTTPPKINRPFQSDSDVDTEQKKSSDVLVLEKEKPLTKVNRKTNLTDGKPKGERVTWANPHLHAYKNQQNPNYPHPPVGGGTSTTGVKVQSAPNLTSPNSK